ncbi:MAG: hypothetical protein ABR514_02010 [Chthoniobacterales bacterium]
MNDWWSIISIAFLVLVPLVPAVILYKLFEQKTVVRGPFKGLRLDLSGAFAGYFLVLLLCSSLFYGPGEKSRNYRNQIAQLTAKLNDATELGTAWTVRGRVALKGSGSTPMEGVGIAILPMPQVYRDGLFEIRVVKDKSAGESARLPTLEISKAGYFPETIHLEPISAKLGKQYSKTIDEPNRIINIDDVIELTKESTP